MKRVLVVGAGSYIGDSFAKYAQGRLDVDVVDSYEEWKNTSFENYDSILMAAGLAHQKWNKKQQRANKDLYFTVNRDLPIKVAKKAKAAGVGQFIYLSSMAVYGLVEGEIGVDTVPSPRAFDYYGLSKYQAEEGLLGVLGGDAATRLCIIRPPMVYGAGCPGKFASLVKVAKVLPVIPKVENKRSMIYINNLSELLCIVVEKDISGCLKPHNKEYVGTAWLLGAISKAFGRRKRIMPGVGWFVRCAEAVSPAAKTAFGSLYYTEVVARMPFEGDYQLVGLEESVVRSV